MDNTTCYGSDGSPLKELYQWDSNQTITIKIFNASATPVFHFCNRLSKEALVVVPEVSGGNLTVKIPNVLLEQPEPIVAYLYQKTGDDSHNTIYTIRIPVRPRPRPSDYEFKENVDYVSTVEASQAALLAASEANTAIASVNILIEDIEQRLESGELNGKDGADGANGKDGISPTVTVSQTEDGTVLTVTDANGTTVTTITTGGEVATIEEVKTYIGI